MASTVSTRATCLRKKVGAVIVIDRTIISTGYNGSLPGTAHCDDQGVGCMMENGHCVRTVHAEVNAIAQAARNGHATRNSTIYCTASPCWPCFKLIVNAGITTVVFEEFYRDTRIIQAAHDARVQLIAQTSSGPVIVYTEEDADRILGSRAIDQTQVLHDDPAPAGHGVGPSELR